jgi:hypothetical protein
LQEPIVFITETQRNDRLILSLNFFTFILFEICRAVNGLETSALDICNMPERRFRSAVRRGIHRLCNMVGLRAQNERINNEADRLDTQYGPPWPKKCSQLPPEWWEGLPGWAFRTRRGRAKPRQQRIDDLNLIHGERMKNYERRKANNKLGRDTSDRGGRGYK